MPWTLEIDNYVRKQLERIQKKDALKIFEVIKLLVDAPYAGDIQKMSGQSDTWRKRVGSYRIFYEIRKEEKIINIYDVKRRSTTTY